MDLTGAGLQALRRIAHRASIFAQLPANDRQFAVAATAVAAEFRILVDRRVHGRFAVEG